MISKEMQFRVEARSYHSLVGESLQRWYSHKWHIGSGAMATFTKKKASGGSS